MTNKPTPPMKECTCEEGYNPWSAFNNLFCPIHGSPGVSDDKSLRGSPQEHHDCKGEYPSWESESNPAGPVWWCYGCGRTWYLDTGKEAHLHDPQPPVQSSHVECVDHPGNFHMHKSEDCSHCRTASPGTTGWEEEFDKYWFIAKNRTKGSTNAHRYEIKAFIKAEREAWKQEIRGRLESLPIVNHWKKLDGGVEKSVRYLERDDVLKLLED